MNAHQEELHRTALLAVACNTIMLEVCDRLKSTELYRNSRKRAINNLTEDLSQFIHTLYKGMGEDEEMQYMALVRTVESGAKALASAAPHEIANFTALIQAFRQGEVYQASTDKQMQNMIDHKKVKRVG